MRSAAVTAAGLAGLVVVVAGATLLRGASEPSLARHDATVATTAAPTPVRPTPPTEDRRNQVPTTTTVPPTTLPPSTIPSTTLPTPVPVTTALPAPTEAPVAAGTIGSIEIPGIGLNRPMYEGIELSTLDYGPGHWPGTAMPGQPGNVVVAGHRVSHNADFRSLDALSPSNEVIFKTGSGRHVYRVVSTEIVEPDAMWIIDQTSDATATLFACHPPGSISQRIVVHLRLVA